MSEKKDEQIRYLADRLALARAWLEDKAIDVEFNRDHCQPNEIEELIHALFSDLDWCEARRNQIRSTADYQKAKTNIRAAIVDLLKARLAA